MSVTYKPCESCALGIHAHEGTCEGPGTVVMTTSGAPIERPTRCDCEETPPLGRSDADTQMEVSFAS